MITSVNDEDSGYQATHMRTLFASGYHSNTKEARLQFVARRSFGMQIDKGDNCIDSMNDARWVDWITPRHGQIKPRVSLLITSRIDLISPAE